MASSELVLRIRTDEDWLRLVAYEAALREIAKDADGEPWMVSQHAEFARAILDKYSEPDR